MAEQREQWGSKLGVILAVAGSAVGLGNFLRFPRLVAEYGGGAFMIPYFTAFLLLGIPLMWVEWTLGRMGGSFGHGSAPGIFDSVVKHRLAKYFGIFGIMVSFAVISFYMYVEAWAFGYAYFSASGHLLSASATPETFTNFLTEFQGKPLPEGAVSQFATGLSGFQYAYIFFVTVFAINFFFIYKGVKGGIEKISKIAMPTLIILAVFMLISVLFMGTKERPIGDALAFVWNPDFGQLGNPKVWIEAAGQIFFTLSVGMGIVLTYASYLKKKDDVALSSLSAAGANEFCEGILGSTIIIPAAFILLGPLMAQQCAANGSFDLGFITSPLIFSKISTPWLATAMSFAWFFLLFLAGITSSVSLIQPSMALLEDELKISRHKAVAVLMVFFFLAAQPAIFSGAALDELDFWGCTLLTVLLAIVEVVIFAWIIGIDKAWNETLVGAKIIPPAFFKFIIKYVTPLYLLVILGWFTYGQFFTPQPGVKELMGKVQTAVKYDETNSLAASAEKQKLSGTPEAIVASIKNNAKWLNPQNFNDDLTLLTTTLAKFNEQQQMIIHAATLKQFAKMEQNAKDAQANKPYIWLVRGMLLFVALLIGVLIHIAWRNRAKNGGAVC